MSHHKMRERERERERREQALHEQDINATNKWVAVIQLSFFIFMNQYYLYLVKWGYNKINWVHKFLHLSNILVLCIMQVRYALKYTEIFYNIRQQVNLSEANCRGKSWEILCDFYFLWTLIFWSLYRALMFSLVKRSREMNKT